ncbi:hypothetical protein BDF20DRAFT_905673 [Mycotypha africana]|uniref:uncharacterized protein n=1 Tax=Mycotypha africana TaxID=64632 RepID=UPI0023011645|nr:uncharacterized protein BDF20DRAFT_905673 [Mycotypha africana]KAI8981957.1 hypothetical protein BDF20DRAFT_905673 [Mycotypha africana]
MALGHLNINYEFEQTMPHSEVAYKYNPFGRIPSLLHKEADKDPLIIFESAAIRDYIDSVFDATLTPKDLTTRIKMDELISILCDYIFHHVIFGVAKPRMDYEQQGKTEPEIQNLLSKPLRKAGKLIEAMDNRLSDSSNFLCGDQLTWADYFVYPVMADLYAIPEAGFFQEKGPRLYRWYTNFKDREEVICTYPDTVADIRTRKMSSSSSSL